MLYTGAEDPVRRAMRQAEAELNRQHAEAARLARSRITVDRAWLLEVLRDLILFMESHRKVAERRGDHARGERYGGRRGSAPLYDALAKDESP